MKTTDALEMLSFLDRMTGPGIDAEEDRQVEQLIFGRQLSEKEAAIVYDSRLTVATKGGEAGCAGRCQAQDVS
jgi:hypothetical protein